MSKIALTESHEEADALNFRDVYGERLKLFVVEKIHVLLAYAVEVVFSLDAHCGDLYPLAVFDVAARSGNFAEVNFRVEVCSESIAVVAAVAV
jgi:hypothetical protein